MKLFVPLTVSFVGAFAASMGCSETAPPASPRSDVRDVRVHRATDKPDFIRLERAGDPTAALAAAYVHAASGATSRTIAKYVVEQLRERGYLATVIPTDGALLVSVSVDDEAAPKNLVSALRGALEIGYRRAASSPEVSAPTPTLCGSGEMNAPPLAPGYQNTVLAAVGTNVRLKSLQLAYETDRAWVNGGEPQVHLPTHDEFSSSPSAEPAELTVAVRTPFRQRIVPAAREIGAPDSLLRLVSESHDGHWRLLSSHASFIPAGGCVSVHLEAQQPVDPLHAARAAKTVLRELDWVIDQQTSDEDPRFNVLEAPNAEESARRAAWEAATRYGFTSDGPSTKFVHYRGSVDAATWKSLLASDEAPAPIPDVTRDEQGQGRVWASLTHRCPLRGEDNTSAGHTAAALLVASNAVANSKLQVLGSWEHQGLVAWQPTQATGAEDRLADVLARSILETLRSPGLASQLVRQPESTLDNPVWTLALTLATSGHPSWLSVRSTPQSRAVFDGGALQTAMRRFVGGPLQLTVLTNHGSQQAQRLNARLAHLLSGVYTTSAECPAVSLGESPSPAGEYDVESHDATRAVVLYVVDRRFAAAVRHLASVLNQPGGWLRRAIEPLAAQVTATGLGTETTMAALGFTVSADTRAAIDAAISQLRVLVSDLQDAPSGSLSWLPPPMPRTPIERLSELLVDATADSASPEARSVAALIGEGLTERRLFVVRPLPLPMGSNSSNPK